MNRILKKTVSLITSFVFIVLSVYTPGTSYAQITNPPISSAGDISSTHIEYIDNISIPKDFGTIKNTHQGPNGKLIIHIQDAHTNYSGQKNLSRILKNLIETYGVNLVLVEGGWGDVGLSILRRFPTMERRKRIAERYLKAGKIAGEEYLDIISDPKLNFSLYGIEDKSLYKSNVNQFLKIDRFTKEANDFIEHLNRSLNALKDRYYSDDLKAFEKKKYDYDNERLDIVSYCKYLKETFTNKENDLNEITSLLQVDQFEKSIDFDAVNTERDDYIAKLSKDLPKDKLETLLRKSLEFKTNAITPAVYYAYIKDLAKETAVDIRKYPNLHIYMYYIALFESIDSENLFKEIEMLEDKVEALLCKNDTELELANITTRLALIRNFVNLRLSPQDFKEYRSNKRAYNLKKFSKFLNKLSKNEKITNSFVYYSTIVDKNINRLEKFYKIAEKRDRAFLKNTLKVMDKKDQRRAVLIAGGFHTKNLMPMFEKEGFSYIVVSPKVKEKTDLSLYRKLLKDTLRIQAIVQRRPIFKYLSEDIIGNLGVVNAADILARIEDRVNEIEELPEIEQGDIVVPVHQEWNTISSNLEDLVFRRVSIVEIGKNILYQYRSGKLARLDTTDGGTTKPMDRKISIRGHIVPSATRRNPGFTVTLHLPGNIEIKATTPEELAEKLNAHIDIEGFEATSGEGVRGKGTVDRDIEYDAIYLTHDGVKKTFFLCRYIKSDGRQHTAPQENLNDMIRFLKKAYEKAAEKYVADEEETNYPAWMVDGGTAEPMDGRTPYPSATEEDQAAQVRRSMEESEQQRAEQSLELWAGDIIRTRDRLARIPRTDKAQRKQIGQAALRRYNALLEAACSIALEERDEDAATELQLEIHRLAARPDKGYADTVTDIAGRIENGQYLKSSQRYMILAAGRIAAERDVQTGADPVEADSVQLIQQVDVLIASFPGKTSRRVGVRGKGKEFANQLRRYIRTRKIGSLFDVYISDDSDDVIIIDQFSDTRGRKHLDRVRFSTGDNIETLQRELLPMLSKIHDAAASRGATKRRSTRVTPRGPKTKVTHAGRTTPGRTKPGRSPMDALKVITYSTALQAIINKGQPFTMKDYRAAYNDVRDHYTDFDFAALPEHARNDTTSRDDLDRLSYHGYLTISKGKRDGHSVNLYKMTREGIDAIKEETKPYTKARMKYLLKGMSEKVRENIVTMLDSAGSGHPGGSLSSAEILTALYFGGVLNYDANDPNWEERDRVVVSAGHKAPALYSVLHEAGFDISKEDLMELRQKLGAKLSGHVHEKVPGVDVSTGALGQGFSEGVGMAAAATVQGKDIHVFNILGDGEDQEGQISEAARHARYAGITNQTVIIDNNDFQIEGRLADVTEIRKVWKGYGWNVVMVDGSDPMALAEAMKEAKKRGKNPRNKKPTCIIAKTLKGAGVRELTKNDKTMEGSHGEVKYDLDAALTEIKGRMNHALGSNYDEKLLEFRVRTKITKEEKAEIVKERNQQKTIFEPIADVIRELEPKILKPGDRQATRNSFGEMWAYLGAKDGKIVAMSPDLQGSVKLTKFEEMFAKRYFRLGIREAHGASFAGGMARMGMIPAIATFGKFIQNMIPQIDMQKMNGIPVVYVGTHTGVGVGADGPTHHDVTSGAIMDAMSGPVQRSDQIDIYESGDPEEARAVVNLVYKKIRSALDKREKDPDAEVKTNPVYLRFTRQDFDVIDKSHVKDYERKLDEGSYILRDPGRGKNDLVIVATGATVPEALKASERLEEERGLKVKVINVVAINKISNKNNPFEGYLEDGTPVITVCDAVDKYLFNNVNAVANFSTKNFKIYERGIDPERQESVSNDLHYTMNGIDAQGIASYAVEAVFNDKLRTESNPLARKRAVRELGNAYPELSEELKSQYAALPVSGSTILERATKKGKPVLACNIDIGELTALQIRGMMKAALEKDAFLMLEVGAGAAASYANGKPHLPEYCAKEAYRLYKETGKKLTYAVHVDHMQPPMKADDYYKALRTLDKDGRDALRQEQINEILKWAVEAIQLGFTSFAVDASTLTKLSGKSAETQLDEVIKITREVLKTIYEECRKLGINTGMEIEEGDVGKEKSTPKKAKTLYDGVAQYKELTDEFVALGKKLGRDFSKEPLTDIIALNLGSSHGYDFWSEDEEGEADTLKEYDRDTLDLDLAREISDELKKAGLNIGLALHGFSGTPIEQAREFIGKGIAKVNISTDWQAIIWKVLYEYYPALYRELFDESRKLALLEKAKEDKKPADKRKHIPVTDDADYDFEHARNRIIFKVGGARKIFRKEEHHEFLERITEALKNGNVVKRIAKEQAQDDHVRAQLTYDDLAKPITALEAIEMLTENRVSDLLNALREGGIGRIAVDRERELRLQEWQVKAMADLVEAETQFDMPGQLEWVPEQVGEALRLKKGTKEERARTITKARNGLWGYDDARSATKKPGQLATLFGDFELDDMAHDALNRATENKVGEAQVRIVKNMNFNLSRVPKKRHDLKIYSIEGWIEEFKKFYREALKAEGMSEYERELTVARVASHIISHPSSYSTADGNTTPSIYIDQAYFDILNFSDNREELMTELVNHEALHIENMIKHNRVGTHVLTENQVNAHASIEKVRAAIKAETILIVQSGGDCAGLNTVVAEAALEARKHNKIVVGVIEGFEALARDKEGFAASLMPIDEDYAKRIMYRPSTELKSARIDPFEDARVLRHTLANANGYGGIIVTGGDDHCKVGMKLGKTLEEMKSNTKVVAIPKSIDNDAMTQMLGFEEASKHYRDRFWRGAETGKGYKKVFIAETIGRKAGWLALATGDRSESAIDELKRSGLGKELGNDKIDHVKDTIMTFIPEQAITIKGILTRAKQILDAKGVINIACSEGLRINTEADSLWKELLKKNPMLAAKAKKDSDVDEHGNRTFASEAMSEYLIGILSTEWNDDSLNLGLEINQIRHSVLGFISRGLKPGNRALTIAKKSAKAAISTIVEGESGRIVTYSDRMDPLQEDPKVLPIEEVLEDKDGNKLTKNLTTLGEVATLYEQPHGDPTIVSMPTDLYMEEGLHKRGFNAYGNNELREAGVVVESEYEPLGYKIEAKITRADNTVMVYDRAIKVLREDFLSTAISAWAHKRGNIFEVPDDTGELTKTIVNVTDQELESWSDEDKATWDKIKDTIVVFNVGEDLFDEALLEEASRIKREYGVVNILIPRGYVFNEDDLEYISEGNPYLEAKLNEATRPAGTRRGLRTDTVYAVKDPADFIQAALVKQETDTFPKLSHARCTKLAEAYYIVSDPRPTTQPAPMSVQTAMDAGVTVKNISIHPVGRVYTITLSGGEVITGRLLRADLVDVLNNSVLGTELRFSYDAGGKRMNMYDRNTAHDAGSFRTDTHAKEEEVVKAINDALTKVREAGRATSAPAGMSAPGSATLTHKDAVEFKDGIYKDYELATSESRVAQLIRQIIIDEAKKIGVPAHKIFIGTPDGFETTEQDTLWVQLLGEDRQNLKSFWFISRNYIKNLARLYTIDIQWAMEIARSAIKYHERTHLFPVQHYGTDRPFALIEETELNDFRIDSFLEDLAIDKIDGVDLEASTYKGVAFNKVEVLAWVAGWGQESIDNGINPLADNLAKFFFNHIVIAGGIDRRRDLEQAFSDFIDSQIDPQPLVGAGNETTFFWLGSDYYEETLVSLQAYLYKYFDKYAKAIKPDRQITPREYYLDMIASTGAVLNKGANGIYRGSDVYDTPDGLVRFYIGKRDSDQFVITIAPNVFREEPESYLIIKDVLYHGTDSYRRGFEMRGLGFVSIWPLFNRYVDDRLDIEAPIIQDVTYEPGDNPVLTITIDPAVETSVAEQVYDFRTIGLNATEDGDNPITKMKIRIEYGTPQEEGVAAATDEVDAEPRPTTAPAGMSMPNTVGAEGEAKAPSLFDAILARADSAQEYVDGIAQVLSAQLGAEVSAELVEQGRSCIFRLVEIPDVQVKINMSWAPVSKQATLSVWSSDEARAAVQEAEAKEDWERVVDEIDQYTVGLYFAQDLAKALRSILPGKKIDGQATSSLNESGETIYRQWINVYVGKKPNEKIHRSEEFNIFDRNPSDIRAKIQSLIDAVKADRDEAEPRPTTAAAGMSMPKIVGVADNVTKLIELLKDKSPEVRGQAARDLAEIGDERAIKPMIEALGDGVAFMGIRMALASMGSVVVESLIEAVSHDNETIRRHAIATLGDIGDERALEVLGGLLQDGWVGLYARRAFDSILARYLPQAKDAKPKITVVGSVVSDIIIKVGKGFCPMPDDEDMIPILDEVARKRGLSAGHVLEDLNYYGDKTHKEHEPEGRVTQIYLDALPLYFERVKSMSAKDAMQRAAMLTTMSWGGPGFASARAAHSLGADVRLVAAVGNDALGEAFGKYMEDLGMNTEGIVTIDTDDQTGDKVNTSVNLIFSHPERGTAYNIASESANDHLTVDHVKALGDLENREVLHLGGVALNKKIIRNLHDLLDHAEANKVKTGLDTVIDIHGIEGHMNTQGALTRLDYFTPSMGEAPFITGEPEGDLAANLDYISGVIGSKAVFLKHSVNGSYIRTWKDSIFGQEVDMHMPALQVEPVETTGAGDAYSGYVAMGIALGLSPEEIAEGASVCGALAVLQEAGGGDLGSNPRKDFIKYLRLLKEQRSADEPRPTTAAAGMSMPKIVGVEDKAKDGLSEAELNRRLAATQAVGEVASLGTIRELFNTTKARLEQAQSQEDNRLLKGFSAVDIDNLALCIIDSIRPNPAVMTFMEGRGVDAAEDEVSQLASFANGLVDTSLTESEEADEADAEPTPTTEPAGMSMPSTVGVEDVTNSIQRVMAGIKAAVDAAIFPDDVDSAEVRAQYNAERVETGELLEGVTRSLIRAQDRLTRVLDVDLIGPRQLLEVFNGEVSRHADIQEQALAIFTEYPPVEDETLNFVVPKELIDSDTTDVTLWERLENYLNQLAGRGADNKAYNIICPLTPSFMDILDDKSLEKDHLATEILEVVRSYGEGHTVIYLPNRVIVRLGNADYARIGNAATIVSYSDKLEGTIIYPEWLIACGTLYHRVRNRARVAEPTERDREIFVNLFNTIGIDVMGSNLDELIDDPYTFLRMIVVEFPPITEESERERWARWQKNYQKDRITQLYEEISL